MLRETAQTPIPHTPPSIERLYLMLLVVVINKSNRRTSKTGSGFHIFTGFSGTGGRASEHILDIWLCGFWSTG